MKTSQEPSTNPLRGIAALFTDGERKNLFKKYLILLGWVEVLILVSCWLYQLGDAGYDRFGPVHIPFPWKAYFLISFLSPVGITFLIGMVIVGFNNYFGGGEPSFAATPAGPSASAESGERADRIHQLNRMVTWLQKLPFLGLLLLLALGTAFFYKLDTIFAVIGHIGEKSVKIALISGAVIIGIASVFVLILIVLNYQLRKKSMEYQYRSEMAERFGLVILEDNTVLSRDGKLLVSGKKFKDAAPALPDSTTEPSESESSALIPTHRAELKTT